MPQDTQQNSSNEKTNDNDTVIEQVSDDQNNNHSMLEDACPQREENIQGDLNTPLNNNANGTLEEFNNLSIFYIATTPTEKENIPTNVNQAPTLYRSTRTRRIPERYKN